MSDKMKKFIKQIIVLTLCVIITAFGATLTMKASLGVGAIDAAMLSISKILFIKVGTIAMLFNLTCIVLQMTFLKKEFKPLQLLQIGVAVLLGIVVNFFFYNIFAEFQVSSYVYRLIILLSGYVIISFVVSIIMSMNIVSMPLEGLCLVLSKKTSVNFGKLRQYVDVISICLVIILTLVLKVELTLREGTVLGMVIFGPMMDKFMRIIKPKLIKYDLI
jgi:uncharacterized membrane protein YczE